ncbi:YfcC family protein [Natranaerobius thermophilus]|uniref:C4-dicarboxylate anaerobic carrier n=1 Tax=Natranaerobius thermophilus (strain ATCC BAA-1301 / DSM 18059 / JW/NM-WN-LF) TaxID=457570 RepID=B2A608_NATTJ|nr:TIGR00366 family protein [Natranaerobius thermophilus]ACB85425.1 C4-dicarboxylate anaerobic carrier [Natranaerobius thermophilus JW/NM-WN-LF]
MKIKVPHTYVLLFVIICITAALTYVIPAGEFQREIDPETDREIVIPGSYETVESDPISPFGIFESIHQGMDEVGFIIFFVLIIGGSFKMIRATGTIDATIGAIVKKAAGKEKLVIPIIMFVFSLAGAVFGMAEELLPFYPIIIALSIALGFDTITGVAMVLLGAGAGFAGAFMNPFTVGIAQGIAGLPLFSGFAFRLIAYVVILGIAIVYVYRYADKIKKNPELSVTYEEDKEKQGSFDMDNLPELTSKHKRVFAVFVVGLLILGYGLIELGFYIPELAALFLIIGVASAIVGGIKPNDIGKEFVSGAQELVYGALIIGVARAIMVVMTEGMIIDTVIYGMAMAIEGLPQALSGVGMFVVQTLINLIVPSGSGQAAVSMPIMAPLADILEITRQTAVLAFQFGDGFSNVISPTSGYFMAAIAIGGISWDKWAKWMLPLFAIWTVVGAIFVAISVMIGYGPF